MAKIVNFSQDTRDKLLRGVNILAADGLTDAAKKVVAAAKGVAA